MTVALCFRFLAALMALALGSVAPAVAADCRELLTVEDEDQEKAPRLTLSDCDISAQFEGNGRTARVILRLKEPAANVWRAALETKGELVFKADGTFTLVREPFERYFDYWGTYRHAAASGVLTLEITGGNKIPSKRSAKGKARVMPSGELLLEDLPPWNSTPGQTACSHVFQRQ